MTTIYVDVLIILNIYVTYFLLKATSKFTHTKASTKRIIIASLIGSFASLTILLPPMSSLLNLVIKLVAALVIVAIAFGFKNKKSFIKLILFFYIMNFIFAGVMLGVWLIFSPTFMYYNNAVFSIDFSPLYLVICTIISYIIVSIVRYFMDRKNFCSKKYNINIKQNSKTVNLKGLADTGNSLSDFFTGKSVIICNYSSLIPLFSQQIADMIIEDTVLEENNFSQATKSLKGLKILPYSTVNSKGTLIAFEPDDLIINSEDDTIHKQVNALIGISIDNIGNKDYEGIFNPSILL